jgi:hypothetical protein
MRAIILCLALCLARCELALAGQIPDNLAVKAVYNEALHDSVSLDAMCHALRNRYVKIGDLRGVYGLRVDRPIPIKEWLKTKETWVKSAFTKDITKGATHWLSDYDLKHCKPSRMAWRFKMRETCYIGQTHFYKEV